MNEIKGFNGLRGLSVLLVIISHGEIFQKLGIGTSYLASIASAYLGVTIFFVLSGFLITLLLINEQRIGGRISLAKFYVRRTLRIFPLYFLAVLIIFILQRFGLTPAPRCAFFYAFTYTINFSHNDCHFMSLAHFWSLAVEEHFYLVWPFVFLLGARAAIFILISIAAFALYSGTALFAGYSETHKIYQWTFPAVAPILFGCLAAYLVQSMKVAKILRNKNIQSVVLALGVAGIATAPTGAQRGLLLASITLLVIFVYFAQQSTIVRFLEWRPLAYVGLISYGLYVWQGVLTGNGPYRPVGAVFPPPLDYGLLLTCFIAPLSYHFFEKPILSLKRHFEVERSPRIDPAPGNWTNVT